MFYSRDASRAAFRAEAEKLIGGAGPCLTPPRSFSRARGGGLRSQLRGVPPSLGWSVRISEPSWLQRVWK